MRKDKELVLIHEISVHPVTTMLSHVDFLGVKKGEAVHAEVALKFVGESPAEKNKVGRVEELLSAVQVFADPTKLPKEIEVDISGLATSHDVIFIKDLKVPAGVKIDNDLSQAVVTVIELNNEAEEEPVVASVNLMVKIAQKLDFKKEYKLADKFKNKLGIFNV